MDRRIIAIITDFGAGDYFTGVMKGVIKAINPDADIVEITIGIAPFSILNAQFVLSSSRRHFPRGTVFLVVVDPGVGSSRRAVAAADGEYSYVLPDNGILSAVKSDELSCREILFPGGKSISSTFHGRDIFAPAAARLSLGILLSEIGPAVEFFTDLPYPPFGITGRGMEGRILHVDTFGNAVTSIPEKYFEEAAAMRFILNGTELKIKAVTHYDGLDDGEAGLYPGSAGFLELALRRGSLAARYGLAPGDPFTVINND